MHDLLLDCDEAPRRVADRVELVEATDSWDAILDGMDRAARSLRRGDLAAALTLQSQLVVLLDERAPMDGPADGTGSSSAAAGADSTAGATGTDAGGAWWNVPIAAVSSDPRVHDAHKKWRQVTEEDPP